MIKTILVHVDESARFKQRIEVATSMANRFDAHLVGAAMTGLSSFMFPVGGYPVGMPAVVFPIEELQADASRALDAFDKAAGAAGVSSYERRMVDDEAGVGCVLNSRYSDLVIISQTVGGEFLPRLRSDFSEYVLLNSSRPVLILPKTGGVENLGNIVTVAWNGSAEAVRAIATAIPVLQKAHLVHVVVFDGDLRSDIHGEEPGADIAKYLARHGINVQVTATQATAYEEDGQSLLTFAVDSNSDLIVMGAFGHSRIRELVLGGMSRTALHSSPVALWMSH